MPTEDPADPEPSPDDEDARLTRLERLVRVQATHHEHLAKQIADLTVAMHTLRKDIPQMMADGMVLAVSDPRFWEAGRKAARGRVDRMVTGAFWGAAGAVWDKAKLFLLVGLLVWAVRGPEVLLDVLRLLWRGPGA